MLTRFHKILLGLLVVQLALLALVWSGGGEPGTRTPVLLVPGFDAAKVTKVGITSGDGSGGTLELVKRDAGWVVASSFDYPADAAKVSEFLAAVAKLAAAEPLATSSARHKQLRVADADFARKVVLSGGAVGGGEIVLYVGATAGARSTAVRLGGTDAVFGVAGVTATSAAASVTAWVDPIYVAVPKADLAGVTVERAGTKIALTRAITAPADGSGAPVRGPWTAAVDGAPIALAAGETLDVNAITRLAAAVATIAMVAPADAKRDATHPLATITLESTHAPIILDVLESPPDELWLHERSKPGAILVSAGTLDAVLRVTRDALVTKPPAAP